MKKLLLCLILLAWIRPALAAEPLKIGLLQIEDSVAFYVAEQEKMYDREGLEVELIPFLSALERDSALAAGAIDGAIDDPVGAILFDQGQGRLKITALCLGETPAEGVFAILAAPQSGVNSLAELKYVEIAVSNSTIIEYVTDRMLLARGFQAAEIRKIEVVKMPIRMQMLLSGAVKAATLPEPLASIAAGKGARALAIEPEILFMDEPLSALDALTRERLQKLILTVWQTRQITTVLVTHSTEEAVFLGRRIIVLSRRPGRILHIVDNPGAGEVDYRQTTAFFQQCTELRQILRSEDDGQEA